MASASSLAYFNSARTDDKGLETVEIDPQFSEGLCFGLGDIVSAILHPFSQMLIRSVFVIECNLA